MIAINLHANDESYELKCAPPIKQTSFASNYEVENYNSKMNIYKGCIDDFIREHKEQIDIHNQALNKAIGQWNTFVNDGKPEKKEDNSITGHTGVSQGSPSTIGHSDPTTLYKKFKF